jgi:hypothetical protein
MLIFIQTGFIVAFLLVFLFIFRIVVIKAQMSKNARRLEEQLIEPCGAAISQGMIRRGSGQRGVVPDSQPSLTWYTRLFS